MYVGFFKSSHFSTHFEYFFINVEDIFSSQV